MRHRGIRSLGSTFAAFLALALAAPAARAETTPRLQISISLRHATSGARTYRMMTKSGEKVVLHAGSQVALPTSMPSAAGPRSRGGDTAETAVTYQNVGFQAQLEGRIDDDGRINLMAHVEDSSRAAGPQAGNPRRPPEFVTLEQDFVVTLDDGVPQDVLAVEGDGVVPAVITIEAHRVR